MNKLGCTAPYGHLNLDLHGFARPCCYFYESSERNYRDFREFNSFEEILSYFANIMQKGDSIDTTCKKCIDYEKIGNRSHRELINNEWMKGATLNNKITVLELALDSICNMACVMCGPTRSTKWTSLIKNSNIEFKSYLDEKPNHFKDIIKLIENSDLSELNQIRFLGGEPLYSKNFEPFLDKIIEKGNPEQIEIKLVTNASVFPKQKLLEKLKKFKQVKLNFSIDAVEEVAELVRYGTDWDIINRNIKEFKKLKNNDWDRYYYGISPTYTLLSIEHAYRLKKYWFKNMREHYVMHPTIAHENYISIRALDKSFRKQFDATPFKLITYMVPENFFQSWEKFDKVDYDKIFKYFGTYEKMTGIDIEKVSPLVYAQLRRQSNV